jgi:hypothetical protein
MAIQFTYPSAAELQMVEQQLLPTLRADNPIFDIFPSVNKDTPLVMWEQLDNFTGMMAPRGYAGKPTNVRAVGSKLYQMQPGVYGEHMTVEEREITISREFGSFNQPIDVTGIVTQRGNQLLHRQLKREAWLGWQLLTNGYFVVTDPQGVLQHADSVTFRNYTPSVSWATTATSTPLADMRYLKTFARGFSVTFGSQARAYANTTTINNLLNNSNQADLGGKRRDMGATFNSLAEINGIMAANDLPTFIEWDGVWQDDSGNNNLDIKNNTVIIVGKRLDAAPIGQWINTRNANNAGMAPGPYYRVFSPEYSVPPTVEIHRGVNGGNALYFPSAVLQLNV